MRMPSHSLHASSRRSPPRRGTNVSLSPEVLAEARELGINLSQASERGLRQAIAEARTALWLEENRAALESSNAWIEANGLPLAGKRLF